MVPWPYEGNSHHMMNSISMYRVLTEDEIQQDMEQVLSVSPLDKAATTWELLKDDKQDDVTEGTGVVNSSDNDILESVRLSQNRLVFVDGDNDVARFYDASTQEAITTEDIHLPDGRYAESFGTDDRLIFLDEAVFEGEINDVARFYNRFTHDALTAEDIILPSGFYQAAFATDDRLIFVDFTANIARFYDKSTRAAITTENITFPWGCSILTAFATDDRLIFVDSNRDVALFYNKATRTRIIHEGIKLFPGELQQIGVDFHAAFATDDHYVFVQNNINRARFFSRTQRVIAPGAIPGGGLIPGTVIGENSKTFAELGGITLPNGYYQAAFATDDRFVFVDNAADIARFYNKSTRAAITTEDIRLPKGSYRVAFSVGGRLGRVSKRSYDVNSDSDLVSLLPASVQSPNIGQQLKLSLKIANGENVAGYQATVQFDETALRFVSSANSDYLPAGAFFVDPKVEGNLVRLNAASLTGESDGDGTLATLTFEVIAAKASTLTLSDVLLSNGAGETFVPQVENAEITEPTGLKEDVNGDGQVNIADLVLVASNLGKTGQNAADVNGDGQVNIADLVLVAGALGNSASAPSLHPHTLEMLTTTEVKKWLSDAQKLDITDTTSQRGILFLQQLLAVLTPKKTALLANYPNPFNPETWVPYHLSKDAEVTITIYGVDGQVVRTLALGHQPAGMYQNRSRAAYWDGRNTLGEPVASGVYFYTLTAGDFTATRRMLILK